MQFLKIYQIFHINRFQSIAFEDQLNQGRWKLVLFDYFDAVSVQVQLLQTDALGEPFRYLCESDVLGFQSCHVGQVQPRHFVILQRQLFLIFLGSKHQYLESLVRHLLALAQHQNSAYLVKHFSFLLIRLDYLSFVLDSFNDIFLLDVVLQLIEQFLPLLF